MTPIAPPPAPVDKAAVVRQLAGAAAVLLGAAAVDVAAWCWDWRSGLAFTGAVLVTGGYLAASEQV